jgi:hypothetical protein
LEAKFHRTKEAIAQPIRKDTLAGACRKSTRPRCTTLCSWSRALIQWPRRAAARPRRRRTARRRTRAARPAGPDGYPRGTTGCHDSTLGVLRWSMSRALHDALQGWSWVKQRPTGTPCGWCGPHSLSSFSKSMMPTSTN